MGSGMGWEVRWADLVLSVAGIIGAVMARGFRVEDTKPRSASGFADVLVRLVPTADIRGDRL